MTTNENYLILPDEATAALTPDTKIVIWPNGLNETDLECWMGQIENGLWHYLPTGCITSFTLEDLLDMCKNGDDPKNHEFVVDTVLLNSETLYVSYKTLAII